MATVIKETAAQTNRSTKTWEADDLMAAYRVIKASAGSPMRISFSNLANTNAASYLKLWNHATPTEGTTVPELILRARSGSAVQVLFAKGQSFGTAITGAAFNTPGTAGTTPPTSDVNAVVTVN